MRICNRKWLLLFILMAAVCFAGCSKSLNEESDDKKKENTAENMTETLAECYRNVYESASKEGTLDSLPVMQEIVSCLGERGFAVVDCENEINMENPEQVREFCKQAEAGQEAEVAILSVLDNGGFTHYVLQASEGKLHVERCILQWEEGVPKAGNFFSFEACSWSYTEKGYLFFEEYRPAGYDGPHGHVAIRVEPLDETCREFNRRYIELAGYRLNNMFLTDWSEADYGELNFYDVYDALYTVKYGKDALYHSIHVGGRDTEGQYGEMEYEIPQEEFEDVILSYFPIDRTVLRQKTVYHEQNGSYRYRARGVYDCGNGSIPRPEVVDYKKNDDGTVTLTVDAVWIEKHNDRALSHEVVVRPFSDGTFQYISNHMIQTKTTVTPSWYRERLTDEEWEEYYGIPTFTDDVYSGMKNYEKMERFLAQAAAGQKSDIMTYQLYADGRTTTYQFAYDGEEMYVYTTIYTWNEEKQEYRTEESLIKIKDWKYTEKGWFCYEMCVTEPPEVTEVINGTVMFRVRPVPEEYRKIVTQYLLPIGYMGNNLFRVEWDTGHMEGIDYTGVYEYLYAMKYGESSDPQKCQGGIPAEAFEDLITEYLPVSVQQLRQWAAFDEASQTYSWSRLGCGNYAPSSLGTSIPEVTDLRENADGTVTATVDAVCERTGEDAVYTHQITMRFTEDGKVQFLGNHIEEQERQYLPPYRFRI